MSQYDETQFYICGEKNNMINYKGKVFSILYPRDQIEEDIVNNCLNCELYGSWNGCQIMRCMNCDTNGCGAKLQGNELNADHPLSANNTYLKDVDWTTIGDIYLSPIYLRGLQEEEQEEEQDEHIQVFLTENGKEEKWFEMKIAEYDEEQEAEQELNLMVNEQNSVFHKINDRFFIETNQFMPAFQDTNSTFCERFQYGCYQSAVQCAVEFVTDLDDEISTSSNSSSTTTYTELPELEENDGNMYFNIVEDYESDTDEELQKLKGTRINPSIDEIMNLADLVENVEEEEEKKADSDYLQRNCKETQENYELQTQTGIFDWPKSRLNEDECSYYGVCFEKVVSDPY